MSQSTRQFRPVVKRETAGKPWREPRTAPPLCACGGSPRGRCGNARGVDPLGKLARETAFGLVAEELVIRPAQRRAQRGGNGGREGHRAGKSWAWTWSEGDGVAAEGVGDVGLQSGVSVRKSGTGRGNTQPSNSRGRKQQRFRPCPLVKVTEVTSDATSSSSLRNPR